MPYGSMLQDAVEGVGITPREGLRRNVSPLTRQRGSASTRTMRTNDQSAPNRVKSSRSHADASRKKRR
jgi:hypothetical protein